jgi:hypothetical protein
MDHQESLSSLSLLGIQSSKTLIERMGVFFYLVPVVERVQQHLVPSVVAEGEIEAALILKSVLRISEARCSSSG